MYPRNAASPERIDIGAVVQISDGAVQTSGCTVRIIPAGGTEGDGAGTTAYSDDGVVLYTPTQAETNYTSFILIAKKAGCIPASKTVVTSANATAGKVTVGTNEDKTGYTASTVSDKTGYSLAAGHGLATEAKQDSIIGYVDCLPDTWVVPAAVGDAMTLTAAYDAAKTAAQAGNAMALTSGERTTLAAAIEAAMINELDGTAVMQAIADLIANDMTGGDLSVQAIAAATRDVLLDRVLAGNHDLAGTVGKLLQFLDVAVSSRLATSGYTAPTSAADIKTALEADGGKLDHIWETTEDNAGVRRFTAAALAESPTGTGAFTDDDRAALAAAKAVTDAMATMLVVDGAVYQFTENALELSPVGSGGFTADDRAAINAAKAVTDKVDTTMELDGAVYRFTTNALEQAPAGSAGSTTVSFALQSTVGAGQVADGSITLYQNAAIAGIVIVVTDEDGDPVDLSAATLVFVVYKDPATVLWSLTEAAGQLTVGGASNNQVTLAADDTNTATAGHYRYALWDTAADLVRARGVLTIEREASAP